MRKIVQHTIYVLGLYALGIIFFTIFRIVLLKSYLAFNTDYVYSEMDLLQALWMGFRFDSVISCYILAVPVLLLCIISFYKTRSGVFFRFTMYWSIILYVLSYIFTAANIPYYLQFNKQINASIWNWMSEPSFVIKMMFSENSFLIYIMLFFIVCILYCLLAVFWTKYSLKKAENTDSKPVSITVGVLCSLILLSLTFAGIRGRLVIKSPIRIGTAYFGSDQFMNQLGLNPVFVLIKTSMDMEKEGRQIVSLADGKKSFESAARMLGMNTDSVSWYRNISEGDSVQYKNVVVILMESFCTDLLEWKDRTPFVNSLIRKSVYFKNTYSAGIHTMNGIHSTLFSYPSLLNQHPLKHIRPFYGLPGAMIDNGYSTMYFTTHDDQFDNVAGFLLANGIERIFAQKDYPSAEIKSNLGVVDDYMLRYAVKKMGEVSRETGKPFFATLLTASNHQPYVIPDYFVPKDGDIRQKIVEYSDWALSRFFDEASKEKWYDNTLFVLLGDHGSPAGLNLYDVSLPYHQIPLIFFEPGREDMATTICDIAGQIDVFPTIMGWLGLPYRDETFGIDLMKEKRKYIYFSSDDSYACVDTTFYYVNRMDGRESLYNYSVFSEDDSLSFYPVLARDMDDYAKTMIQAAQYIVKHK